MNNHHQDCDELPKELDIPSEIKKAFAKDKDALKVVTDPKDISNPPILSLATVRTLLALAWLSFVLVLGLGGLSLGLLTNHEEKTQGTLAPNTKRKLRKLGFVAVVLLYGFTITGFVFMAIALAAYVQVVAFVAIGCTTIAGIIATIACFYQWQKVPN